MAGSFLLLTSVGWLSPTQRISPSPASCAQQGFEDQRSQGCGVYLETGPVPSGSRKPQASQHVFLKLRGEEEAPDREGLRVLWLGYS